MIELRDASFAYRHSKPVFEALSVELEGGHCVAILGNNGAGKSTLLRCVNRILKLSSGSISVCGKRLEDHKRREIAQTISYVEQHNSIYEYTVFDTILLGRKPYIHLDPTENDMQIVRDVISRLGLGDYELRLLSELSGGEVQKVLIARALAQQPKVLLLDEPTSNLDLRNQHEVMRLVSDIAKRDNILVIVVIHDLNLAVHFCDRFMLLHNGAIYAYGDQSVLTDETLTTVYGINTKIARVGSQCVVMADLDEPLDDNKGEDKC